MPSLITSAAFQQFELDFRHLAWRDIKLSANDRFGFRKKNEHTQFWKSLARISARGLEPMSWAHVVIWVRYPNNVRREVSNLQPTAKAIVDGIVAAGVLADDRDELVTGPDLRRLYPNGPHRVVVELRKGV